MRDTTDEHERVETGPDPVGASAPTDSAGAETPDSEAAILRSELAAASRRLGELEAEASDAKDRFLRSRAEFETFRRRMADELNLAREAGLDSAVLPVLAVYDDLERAVAAASTTPDPSTILPGVIAVKDGLVRALDALGIRPVGAVGDAFDPDLHEALAVVPPGHGHRENAIAQVYQAGFVKGDRVIRHAKVVVAKSG